MILVIVLRYMVSSGTIDQSLWVGLGIPRFEDPEDAEKRDGAGKAESASKGALVKSSTKLETTICLQTVGSSLG
jgi:hypothetical protein